ncbi:hypothetical protein FOL47_001314 [Perkinsus chesapeaki]|uniref:Uncharacterized protein n=1 Tax=Perkinsus chesapeaki TaxID=330153 RepID=A0A7J6MJU9_PERCH|nr:hypothetical protein FOL47_001314 [Perkinsus chesapeaki]
MKIVEDAVKDGSVALTMLVKGNEELIGELEKPVVVRIVDEVRSMCEAGTIPAQQLSDIFGVLARERRECLRVSEEMLEDISSRLMDLTDEGLRDIFAAMVYAGALSGHSRRYYRDVFLQEATKRLSQMDLHCQIQIARLAASLVGRMKKEPSEGNAACALAGRVSATFFEEAGQGRRFAGLSPTILVHGCLLASSSAASCVTPLTIETRGRMFRMLRRAVNQTEETDDLDREMETGEANAVVRARRDEAASISELKLVPEILKRIDHKGIENPASEPCSKTYYQSLHLLLERDLKHGRASASDLLLWCQKSHELWFEETYDKKLGSMALLSGLQITLEAVKSLIGQMHPRSFINLASALVSLESKLNTAGRSDRRAKDDTVETNDGDYIYVPLKICDTLQLMLDFVEDTILEGDPSVGCLSTATEFMYTIIPVLHKISLKDSRYTSCVERYLRPQLTTIHRDLNSNAWGTETTILDGRESRHLSVLRSLRCAGIVSSYATALKKKKQRWQNEKGNEHLAEEEKDTLEMLKRHDALLLSLNRRIRSTARVEDFDDFTLREAANNIRLMHANTSSAVSSYCELILARLQQPGLPRPHVNTLVHIIKETHSVIVSKGVSAEMAKMLVQCVLLCLSSNAPNSLSRDCRARLVEVCSTLLDELPYGSPLRSQVVASLTQLAKVMTYKEGTFVGAKERLEDMPVGSTKSSQSSEPRLDLDTGVVNEEIGKGISLWTFFFICSNIVISQALSIPFMFTTAGWVAFVTQALAAVFTFICVQLARIALRDRQVVGYAERKDIPPFEREYTFLGEFCAGSLGRAGITLFIFLEYYTGLSTILAAIGLCVELIIPQVKAEYWILVFGILTLILVLVPWLREVSAMIGVLAMIGTIGSMLAWVGSAFSILPDSNLADNLIPRDPLFINIANAGSLSIWTFAGVPSIVPYTGVVQGSSNRRTSFVIFVCFVIGMVYVAVIGIGGMQICTGVCDPFYPKSLEGVISKEVPTWLMYCLYISMLIRMVAMAPIALILLMISTETFLGNILFSMFSPHLA